MVRVEGIIRKILYFLFFLFLIYIIVQLVVKIFGGSLGFEELMIGLLVANIGLTFSLKDCINKIDAKLSGHIGWHKGRVNKS